MITLRDYQLAALDAETEHRAATPAETRLAVVMATGLGKTIVMAERAVRHVKAHPYQRVLLLVHTDELAQQAEAKVKLVAGTGISVGVVMAGRDEVHADIVIGSVPTLARWERRARLVDVGLVLVDECHHAVAPSYQTILAHYGCLSRNDGPVAGSLWPVTPALGFTATLERGDGASLGGVWQDVAYSRDISWAVRKGHLVQPVGYRLEIGVTDLASMSAERMDDALVDSLAPAAIVAKWLELAAGESTVAFMPLVKSSRALADAFRAQGVEAAVVWGDMPTEDRRLTLKRYEAGDITVLVNAMMLTEGWDSPRTSCVIIGRGTKSRPLFVQMAGRGLRPVPWLPVEQQRCLLLVVADSTTDLCTVADLSDRPLDRRTQGALTAMEDAWDIGKDLEDPEHVWEGQVSAAEFDPLVRRSSKVWQATQRGTPFLVTGRRGYVFLVGTSVYAYEVVGSKARVRTLAKDLPDLELAMLQAEDEAQDRGGDLGAMLADKGRPWRNKVPKDEMVARAGQLGLAAKVEKIMAARAGGKAGKVSDLMATVIASRTLEPMVARIKERQGGQ